MANTAQATSFTVGKLTPEEAERIAASFRPAWELDDAPFAQGNGLSAAEVEALGGGAGIAPAVNAQVLPLSEPEPPAATTQSGRTVPKAARVEEVPAQAVIVEIEPDPTPPPRVVAAPAAPVAPAAPRRTERTVQTRPAPVEAQESGEYNPVKKPNKGIFIGVGAVVGLILLGVVVRAAIGKDEPKSTQGSAQSTAATQEERHIPPPPPVTDDTPAANTAQAAAATAATTAAATTTATTAAAVRTAAPVVTSKPTSTGNTTSAAAPTSKPASTSKPATGGTSKPNTKGGGGGIVHDVQF